MAEMWHNLHDNSLMLNCTHSAPCTQSAHYFKSRDKTTYAKNKQMTVDYTRKHTNLTIHRVFSEKNISKYDF